VAWNSVNSFGLLCEIYSLIVLFFNCSCQSTAAGRSPTIVSGAAVSTAGRTEWQIIAHEIGHNFGAIVSTLVHKSTKAVIHLPH
jgi:hypothetical protein